MTPAKPASRNTFMTAADRSRRSFVWGVEILITALGVVAIVGPEEAEPIVTKILGLLLMLTAFLGLLAALIHSRGVVQSRSLVAWAAVAFATGALIQWLPARGLPSLGTVIGVLLIGHGLTAAPMALRFWKTSGVKGAGLGLAASLLLLTGLAMLFGKDLGDRLDELMIGLDIVLFSGYLIIGRLLIEAQNRSPATPHDPG
jgi:uncharacterized membrane protein HdeD (DUF308 family)